jgi:hypothetical protein
VPAFPVAHISWSIADNADRKGCDAFFQDVFGAQTAYEMLITPEAEAMGLDREESLMLIGDTMVIPIAPAGKGAAEGHPAGDMFRRSAAPMRWLGLALRGESLADADAWFAARGFKRHYDPGMEEHYFLVPRGQVLGVRLELLCHGLPNDPREDAGWRPGANPLGIEGLQAIGVSVPSLAEARRVFGETLELRELGQRELGEAQVAAFDLGDTVIEALAGADGSDEARHAVETKGICSLTFKVADIGAARAYLIGKDLPLIAGEEGRIAITPEAAHGRLIWLTDRTPAGYPEVGSKLPEGARL